MEYGYRGPSIDHGLLSPSGHASKRARKALVDDYKRRVEAWWDAKYPPPTAEEHARMDHQKHLDGLRAEIKYAREWQARGVQPRKMAKMAERAEAELAKAVSP